MVFQKEIVLPRYKKGFHIITSLIEEHISQINTSGILHIFVKHTSAGITVNENADPSVRIDFEQILNKLFPEDLSFYTHIFEGSDDMPAHIKSSMIGSSVSIPITNGKMNIGLWQGIYFCEFRNAPSKRNILLTFIS